MNKRLVRDLIIVSLLLSLATFAYAGTSTVMFDGSGGEILIVTSSPGIEIDNFQVVGKGEFSAKQQVSTYSPTTIVREGGFSGGGSMMVITQADAPQVEFGAYLQASDSGYLGQTIDTGSSVMFDLNIWGEGEGDLEVFSEAPGWVYFDFGLLFDVSTMSVTAQANPFTISWITSFDEYVQISGLAEAH